MDNKFCSSKQVKKEIELDYIKNTYELIDKALIKNKFNFYALVISILVFVTEYIVWQEMIVKQDVFVYSVLTYFPLELFAIVFVIHVILAVYSFRVERMISNLLLGFNIFFLYLIFIIEAFYLIN